MKCQTMRRKWKEVGGGMETSSVVKCVVVVAFSGAECSA